MELLVEIALFVALLVVGGLIGRARERAHLRQIDEREAGSAGVLVTDLRVPPPGVRAREARLVTGEVVVASDYFKAFAASLRNILGGEMRSYRPMMDRARREARLRMVEEARSYGASLVINVRYETSMVGTGGVEVYCYGTALVTSDR